MLEHGWLLFRKIKSFETKQVYVSGNPALFDQGAGRPILVDIVKTSNASSYKISSVLAPIGRLAELPFKKNSLAFFGVNNFVRKSRRLLTLIFVALFGLIGVFVAELITASQTSASSSFSAPLAAVLGMFSGFVFTSFGGKVLKEIYPEDNDIIIRQTKKSNVST